MERLVDMYPLKLPVLTLVQLAAVKVSEQLWKLPDIKNLLKLCIRLEEPSMNQYREYSKEKKRTFRAVFDKTDQLEVLPATLRSNVKYIAMQLGINVFHWLLGCLPLLLEDTADNLQFDFMGFVDSVETIRSLYYSGKMPRTSQCMASIFTFAIEDCIRDYCSKFTIQNGMSELNRCLVLSSGEPHPFPDHWRSYIEAVSLDITTQKPTGSKIKPIEDIPLKLPIMNYHLSSYCWNNLSDERRRKCFTLINEIHYTELAHEGLSFAIDRINFALNSMTEAGRTDFREKNSLTLEMLVLSVFTRWPFRHLFLPIITPALSHMNPEIYFLAFHEVLKISYFENQLLDNKQKYNNYVRYLWKNAPESVQLEFLSATSSRAVNLIIVLMVSNIELLREFFQDADLSVVRELVLTASPPHCRFQNGCFEILDCFNMLEEFMHSFLKSDEERNQFQRNFAVSEMYLRRGPYRSNEEAWEEYLYWRYNSSKEIE